MLSLKLNTANRFIGSLLLVSFGILGTLLVLTFKGSAIPAGKATLMIDLFNPSPTTAAATIVDLQQRIPVITIMQGDGSNSEYQSHTPHFFPVHLNSNQWQEQPIRLGAEIAAGVTIFLGLLYVGLKFLYRYISREVFP
jgi:hypothetical protein